MTDTPTTKLGIKETEEALMALNAVSVLLIKTFKDGFQAKDIATLAEEVIASADLRSSVTAAFEGMSAIPAEVKDLDISEGFQLASEEVKFIIEAIQGLKA